MAGSTSVGGHNTPSDCASVSPSGFPASCEGREGSTLCFPGAVCVGAQFVARSGFVAVGACGVDGAGAA